MWIWVLPSCPCDLSSFIRLKGTQPGLKVRWLTYNVGRKVGYFSPSPLLCVATYGDAVSSLATRLYRDLLWAEQAVLFFSQLLNQDIQCKPGEVSLCLKRAKHGQSEGEGRKQGKQIETRIFQVKIYGLLRLFVCHFLWLWGAEMRVLLACPPEGILAFVFGIQSNSGLARAHSPTGLGQFYRLVWDSTDQREKTTGASVMLIVYTWFPACLGAAHSSKERLLQTSKASRTTRLPTSLKNQS